MKMRSPDFTHFLISSRMSYELKFVNINLEMGWNALNISQEHMFIVNLATTFDIYSLRSKILSFFDFIEVPKYSIYLLVY